MVLLSFFSMATYSQTGDHYASGLVVREAPHWGGYMEVKEIERGLMMIPQSGIVPLAGSFITSINDKNTKGMSIDEFYNIINLKKSDSIALKYIDPRDNNRTERNFVYKRYLVSGTWVGKWYDKRKQDNTIRVYRDNDIDFSKYRTYDYLITDPKEKDMAQEVAAAVANSVLPLKRDTENPDLLIKVSFNEDRNVSSTYIPPSTRVETLGSTTSQRYDYLTKKTYYETENDTRTIKEGNYTETTVTNQFYLEVAFLDTRMMNDPKRTVAPVVWSLTYKDVVAGKTDIFIQGVNVIKTYCSQFPYTNKEYLSDTHLCGYFCNDDQTTITFVIPGSQAEKMGLKVGDILLKVSDPAYSGLFNRATNWQNDIFQKIDAIVVKRGKEKITLKGPMEDEIKNGFLVVNEK